MYMYVQLNMFSTGDGERDEKRTRYTSASRRGVEREYKEKRENPIEFEYTHTHTYRRRKNSSQQGSSARTSTSYM